MNRTARPPFLKHTMWETVNKIGKGNLAEIGGELARALADVKTNVQSC